jgi:hypothetical protein
MTWLNVEKAAWIFIHVGLANHKNAAGGSGAQRDVVFGTPDASLNQDSEVKPPNHHKKPVECARGNKGGVGPGNLNGQMNKGARKEGQARGKENKQQEVVVGTIRGASHDGRKKNGQERRRKECGGVDGPEELEGFGRRNGRTTSRGQGEE